MDRIAAGDYVELAELTPEEFAELEERLRRGGISGQPKTDSNAPIGALPGGIPTVTRDEALTMRRDAEAAQAEAAELQRYRAARDNGLDHAAAREYAAQGARSV